VQVLEMQALARVREQNINVHLMIPFVRTRWAVRRLNRRRSTEKLFSVALSPRTVRPRFAGNSRYGHRVRSAASHGLGSYDRAVED
jgi:hypothetical protein